MSDAAGRELSTRIRKLRIKGFRDANRAPHDRLVETIVDAIAEGGHGFAAAILATCLHYLGIGPLTLQARPANRSF